MTDVPTEEKPWGRVLLCGGTDWATNGKKERANNLTTDLVEPHILRSICNVKVTKIVTGPNANYAIVIDVRGTAHLFGKSPSTTLAPAPNNVISEHAPLKITTKSLGLPAGTKWIGGAAGRSHFLLVDDTGSVWGCGNNVVGQIGLPVCQEVGPLTRITGPWTKDKDVKIVQVTAGVTFSLFLTDRGEVYAAGSSEKGQLGNGKTGERIIKGGKVAFDVEYPARLINQGINGKKIVQIASGSQHSIAMDDQGYVWAWGYAGYSRLGLGDQKDRLIPTMVPQFSGNNIHTRAAEITCGPTSSVVIDKQRMFLMAGKWKLTGDGSTGQPWTTFKYIQDIMSCKILSVSCGGVTHLVTTPADAAGGVMTVGFGQGALYGEMGFGPELGKSATKPQEITPLTGIDVIDVAGGAFFSLFLARPNAKLSDIPRYPVHVDSPSICVVCDEDREEEAGASTLLECEKCDQPYHIGCLTPPLTSLPEGQWFCPECEEDEDAPVKKTAKRSDGVAKEEEEVIVVGGAKEVEEEEEEEEEEEKEETTPVKKMTTGKRKAGSTGKGSAKRRK